MQDVLHLYATLCLSVLGESEGKAVAGELLLASVPSKQLPAVFGFWVFLKLGTLFPKALHIST